MLKPEPTVGDTSWFTHDRFGLFLHWGLYSQGARHEWLMQREKITVEEYERLYFKRFDPDLYDPELWADAAADAGMKYFVITTKHHEGFCLWDSKFTDYKAPNTAAKRDLIKPMVAAFRKRDMRVGFYHSLIDWHHPDFVLDPMGPYRENPDREKLNVGRDQKKYAKYLYNQTKELLTKYGKIDVLWYDFSYPDKEGRGPAFGKGRDDWQSEKLLKLVRELQPEIMVNDRLDLPATVRGSGDFKTPEQLQPEGWVHVDGKPVVWETCQTLSGSWGYHRDESSWRSIEQLIHTLIDSVSKGGNFLLNVGPTGRGEFDERAMDRLKGIGQWMRRHSRSIYGCTQAPAEFTAPKDCRYTFNPKTKRLYLHIFAWPYKHIALPSLGGKVAYAQLLNDASEVKLEGAEAWQARWNTSGETVQNITLPQTQPNVTVPVVELFLKD